LIGINADLPAEKQLILVAQAEMKTPAFSRKNCRFSGMKT